MRLLLLSLCLATIAHADFVLGLKPDKKKISRPIPAKVNRLVAAVAAPSPEPSASPVPAIPEAKSAPSAGASDPLPVVSSAPSSPSLGGGGGLSGVAAAKTEAGNQTTYDENAPRSNGGSSPHKGGDSGGGGGTAKGNVVAYDKWWPMCVFIDPSVKNGNEVVHEMVRMAADECQVNVVVFPFYIKGGYPKDPNALKNMARKKCNAQDGFGKFGVNRASVAVLTGDTSLPNKMCGRNGGSETACGEVGWSPGQGIEQRMRSTGRWGGVAPRGQGAVAVIGAGRNGMIDPAQAAGAAQGQAQMSRPPGYGGGNGTGDIEEGQAGGGSGAEKGWSKSGCAAMRAASFNNDGKWKFNPKQEEYVMKDKNESRLFDLAGAKPIFGEPPGPPKEGGGSGGSSESGGGGGSSSGSASGGAAAGLAGLEDSDAGHKKAPGSGGSGGDGGLSGVAAAKTDAVGGARGGLRLGGADTRALYGNSAGGAEKSGDSETGGEKVSGGGGPSQNLSYDESVGRLVGGGLSGVAAAKTDSAAINTGGGGNGTQFGYGPKGGGAVGSQAGAFGGSQMLILGKPIPSAADAIKDGLDGDFFKRPGAAQAQEAKREPGAALRKSGATEYGPAVRRPASAP